MNPVRILFGACGGRIGLFCGLALAAPAADDSATFRVSSTTSWPFVYEEKVFGEDVLLDMRSLNEARAGERGFIRRSDDGNSFVLADGSPVRFWAVNIDTGLYYGPGEVSWSQARDYLKLARRTFDPDRLKQHARWLAKMGVNLVRLNVSLPPKRPESNLTEVNEPVLDEAFRIVAAMKDEGIYTVISPYWPHANFLNVDTEKWGLAGYETPSTWDSGTPLWGLLFFNERLQSAYRGWLRALYTRPNPYTGTPLAAEPAVAIIQLVNEDSLLFGTEPEIRPEQRAILAAKFTHDVITRYGSLKAAQSHWGNAVLPKDAPELLQLLTMEEIRDAASPLLQQRVADQFRFYVETMRSFYADTARFLRDELGCQQLINAGNWRTIDDRHMLAAERYAYTANEVIGVNTYFASEHRGPERGYRVNVGDTYRNMSALTEARLFPPLVKHVEGFPMFMSESTWVYPNFHQSEAPLLVAAYGAMSGVDAYAWHTFRAAPEYDTDILFLQNKWNNAHPALAAGFPAAALIFRRALVKEARPVSVEHRAREDLWRRQSARFNEASGFDPNRDRERDSTSPAWKNNAAFLVGGVRMAFDRSGPDTGALRDLSEDVSADGRQIRSNTGELLMDRGRQILSIDASQVQGVVGFLKYAGPVQLGQVRIQSENDYAHLVVVALDGKPISSSDRLLAQAVTTARPTDWEVESTADGLRTIKNLGHSPWRIERLRARVEVLNTGLTSAVALDPMGRRTVPVALVRGPDGVAFDFPDDAFYVILSRDFPTPEPAGK